MTTPTNGDPRDGEEGGGPGICQAVTAETAETAVTAGPGIWGASDRGDLATVQRLLDQVEVITD